jgi:hypothetical protein
MKSIAKRHILNHILMRCVKHSFVGVTNIRDNGDCYKNGLSFEYSECREIKNGSLIIVSSSADMGSEFTFGWLEQKITSDEFIIRDPETDKLCKWSNSSFYALNKEFTDKKTHWHWTDDQYKFVKRMSKIIYKQMCLISPEFEFNDLCVKVKLRKKFTEAGKTLPFKNYKKIKVSDFKEIIENEVKNEE